MKSNDIIQCQHCGENVFFEDCVDSKQGLICKCCSEPVSYLIKEEEKE